MHKKILSYILIAAMTMGSFNINTLKVRANEISAVEETGNSNLGTGDLEIEIPETDRPEVENPEIEIPEAELPGGEGSDIEQGEVPQDKEEDELIPEDEEVFTEGIVEDMLPEEVPEEKNVTEEKENLDELAEKYRAELPDGTYYIRTVLSNKKVIGVEGKSASNKAKAVIGTFEKSDSQRWIVQHDEKGYITFVNEKSGKVLDVSNGGRNSDKTVWQYTSNNTLAQKWIARKDGKNYAIISAINGMVLDVKGGSSSENAGLQIHNPNSTVTQRFHMISTNPEVEKCEEVIPSGYYYIAAKSNAAYVLDISGGSDANKANVQLYKGNNTFAQAFDIRYRDGYYTIRNMYSNKMLDVASGGFMPATNVWQYNDNGTKAQKWSVKENDDGSYTFINVHSGMALDVANGKIVSKSNIQVYMPNGSEAQKFVLKKADDFYKGFYNIRSVTDASKVLEIEGGKTGNKTNIQIYNSNKTESQKWIAEKNDDGTFSFINSKSGKAMDISKGNIRQDNIVWAYDYNRSLAQKWKVEKLKDNTWRIVSAKDENYVLGLDKDVASNKTKVVIQKWENKRTQKWTFSKVNVAKRVMRVEINEGKELVVDRNRTRYLKAKEVFTNGVGTEIEWKSSNSSVTVSKTGKITGIRHGNAVVTAISKTDKSKKAEIRIYVKETKGQLEKSKLDSINLSKIKKLMIVAHPDDETFWGGGHLLEDDWLVVCITNGRSKTRRKEFTNAMKYSGDKAIMLDYADINDNRVRDDWKYAQDAIQKDIKLLTSYKKWDQIVVHNPEGEYGHVHHKMVNKYVTNICKEKGLIDKLYYFGKFYKVVPNNLKSNLSKKTFAQKKKMIRCYPTRIKAYEEKWKQMEGHEHWVQASKW